MMVAVCLNATILLEQPAQSFFEYYPRWRDFLRLLSNHGGPHCVSWLGAIITSSCVQDASKACSPQM